MLIAALGCNLAWGLIDAVMYLLSTRGERAFAARTLAEVRERPDPGGRAVGDRGGPARRSSCPR